MRFEDRELELAKNEAEKELELGRIRMTVNKTGSSWNKTGFLWKLKMQTQRHALELFLSDCWERLQQFSEHEIRQICMKKSNSP